MVSPHILIHIGRFGIYYAHKLSPIEIPHTTKTAFTTLFQSLFEPYYAKTSAEDVVKRQRDLDLVFDAAEEFGMSMVGYPAAHFEYDWGERGDRDILTIPALIAVYYKGQEVDYPVVVTPAE